ncbi:MAG: hypothetical protein DHS20C15_09990 [Planctomycetota bacterium]|nr:MAG: hypothetical protein DHS20C15_09990 [Planctomycetota bacterium]
MRESLRESERCTDPSQRRATQIATMRASTPEEALMALDDAKTRATDIRRRLNQIKDSL